MTTRLLLVLTCLLASSVATAQIISEATANKAGLSRAWFAIATQDAPTHGVAGAVVQGDTIYVLGGSGVLTAYDTETGFSRWSTRCGRPGQPVFGPSVNDLVTGEGEIIGTRCGVISGTDLHVINAANGEFVLSRPLVGSAGGPPAITTTHAFVPQLRGLMVGYPFDTLNDLPRRVASPGSLTAAPALVSERLIWSTDRGDLYGANSKTGRAAYQFDTEAPVAGSPSYAGEVLCFVNREGVVFGMKPSQGSLKWRTALGASVEKSAVAVDDLVLVADQTPTLHALSLETGAEFWRVEGLSEFVSASADRVYALSPNGALGVLDRATGQPIGSWPARGALRAVENRQTDRLFLISESGVLHCFHETGRTAPYRHDGVKQTPPIPDEIPAPPGAQTPPSAEAPVADGPGEDDPFPESDDPFGGGSDDPFGSNEPAEEESADPFGAEDEDPFSDGEDPFGF